MILFSPHWMFSIPGGWIRWTHPIAHLIVTPQKLQNVISTAKLSPVRLYLDSLRVVYAEEATPDVTALKVAKTSTLA